ncbi:MAG: ParB/RepB/Spo0J family partition protein [Chloroflexi bacterium]|nr:ParB/RepB/Spo0J family partition protein [Chloroflexota bacterium]
MPDITLIELSVELIEASSRNPRRRVEHIDELAESIQAYGLLQPIVVRPGAGGRYELVAGHRRLAAVKALGWQLIQAVVRNTQPDDAYILTLIENLQRENLSAREESRALEELMRERGWTTRQVADAVKRSASYVSRRLRVFEDTALAPLVLAGQLSVSVAEELLPLSKPRKQALAKQAAQRGWRRPQVRAAVRQELLRSATGPRTSLVGRARALRLALRGLDAAHLQQTERRELRLLFRDLTLIAKGRVEPGQSLLPDLPAAATSASRG